MLSEAVTGNFSALLSILADRDRREGPVRAFIEDRLEMFGSRTGPIIAVSALRTIPEFLNGRKTAQTVVEFRGEKGSFYISLFWDGEKNIGFSPMMPPQKIHIPFLQISELRFAGYHLSAGQVLTLDFVRKNGRITSLLFSSKAGGISAGKK